MKISFHGSLILDFFNVEITFRQQGVMLSFKHLIFLKESNHFVKYLFVVRGCVCVCVCG